MSAKVKDALEVTLHEKKTVITKAVFWKIPHNNPETEDIRLKVGRYKKPKSWLQIGAPTLDNPEPKSELTLDNIEFNALIEFLQTNYEPFRKGFKEFITIDDRLSGEFAEIIKELFQSRDLDSVVEYIHNNEVISEELEIGLQTARRIHSIKSFEEMLNEDLVENEWQKWFETNSWVLGSEFVRILDHRRIDSRHIADFLMQAYDGFLDIIELKRPSPELRFWAPNQDHGNWYPSQDLVKAVTQASNYIFEVERESNSVKFLEDVDNVPTIKPRGILVFGRSNDWDQDKKRAYRLLNSSFHNLTILTYDHVLDRANRILGIYWLTHAATDVKRR